MKLVVTSIIVIISCSQMVTAQSIGDFQWLEGTWQRANTKPGTSAFESWKLEDGWLSGVGVTLQGTDTVFIERLKIMEKDEAWYYVAEVSHNAAPTYFKISAPNKDGFTSKNPEHDFPKKIEYVRTSRKEMLVTISGDGKAIPFRFLLVND